MNSRKRSSLVKSAKPELIKRSALEGSRKKKSPPCERRAFLFWLPARDSRQNFIGHKFGFILFCQKDKPTPIYCLIESNSIVDIYFPLIFYRKW